MKPGAQINLTPVRLMLLFTAPDAKSKGKWLYYEESYGDVFILNQRIAGLRFVTEGTGGLSS